jgi:ribosomal protein L35
MARHILTSKSRTRKRRLRMEQEVSPANLQAVKDMLPY